MMKNNSFKTNTIITTIVCLIPVVLGIILYSRLPDVVATHWGADGQPNGWSPKFVGVIVFPGSLALINILFPFPLKMDPKRKNMDSKLILICQWIIPLVSMFASGITLAAGLGKDVNVELFAMLLLGIVFVAIGNYMPKTKQSYTMGIKLPWTLNSEENWNKTHRMAGFLWVIGGILLIIAGIFGITFYVAIVAMILMTIVPIVYSYVLYTKGI